MLVVGTATTEFSCAGVVTAVWVSQDPAAVLQASVQKTIVPPLPTAQTSLLSPAFTERSVWVPDGTVWATQTAEPPTPVQ